MPLLTACHLLRWSIRKVSKGCFRITLLNVVTKNDLAPSATKSLASLMAALHSRTALLTTCTATGPQSHSMHLFLCVLQKDSVPFPAAVNCLGVFVVDTDDLS